MNLDIQDTKSVTPRERIRTALAHRQPDRVPFCLGFGPTPEMTAILVAYARDKGFDWNRLAQAVTDKIIAQTRYVGPLPPLADLNLTTEIWGIKTRTANYGGGVYDEFTDFPLAGVEDIAMLDNYPWPDPTHFDYSSLRSDILQANPEGRQAVQIFGGNPFETYSWMTGIEETFLNLAAEPDLVRAALSHITAFLETKLDAVLNHCGDLIDIVFFGDDLGGQTGLLMSTQTYRDVIQPFHRRLIEKARQRAPHAQCMFHTDGAVFHIIPDLIEAGIDILEAIQTDAEGMDPARLKEAYGKQISFQGGISVQQLLPHGDVATVERECRRLVEILGENGGYIAAPSHAIQVGTPPENVMAMLGAVLGKEDMQRALEQAVL